MDEGKKRAVMVDHRRCGKDKVCFNRMVKCAFERVGVYYYFFPTYNQGRKILWDGVDKDGFKFLSHIPQQLIAGQTNATEMKIPLVNGSIIQVIGSDNIDSIVGTNPVGCVFSEYALQDPRGWDFIRPILRENGGWAMFPYTPRGKNHGWDLYKMASQNDEWYCERLTIDDTFGRGGTVGPEDINSERRAGMSENLIQQEFYVSFEAAVEHAVFGPELWKTRNDKRICRADYIAGLPVNTYWDIGFSDSTAIWFEQTVRGEIHLIDYHEGSGAALDYYIKVLRDKPYVYGQHFMPHDAAYKDFQTGKSTQEVGWSLGINFEVVPKLRKEHQIDAGRMLFSRCWFDENRCERGVDALSSYHYEFDTEKRILSAQPVHDWASHAADAFLLLAVAHRDDVEWKKPERYGPKRRSNTSYMAA